MSGRSEYSQRKGDALAKLMNDNGRDLAVEQAVQYIFSEQWCALRATMAAERKIQHPRRRRHLR